MSSSPGRDHRSKEDGGASLARGITDTRSRLGKLLGWPTDFDNGFYYGTMAMAMAMAIAWTIAESCR